MSNEKLILTEDDFVDAVDRTGAEVRVPKAWLDVVDFGFTAKNPDEVPAARRTAAK